MTDDSILPADSVSRAQRIDQLCDAFEAAWKAGERPAIESGLGQVVEADRQKLLRELVPIDVTYRLIRGEQPQVADYVPRFGGLDAAWVEQLIGEHSQPKQGSGSNDPTAGLRPSVAGSRPVIRYFGDYELLAEVARGGMGVVYRARQVKLNRVVAVKMILSGQLASPADVERFHTEAEAAAQLDHPGIVPIYEVGQHEGLHYFSMGFVEGQSLSARLVEGPLPVREAVTLVRSVSEAVQYAHDKGVIHRDLKPGNILVGTDGKPRVTDFGLAKLTESGAELTGTGQVLGTPSFMPPEQAAAQVSAVGRASDIYSLGAVLYCLLTGRPPFQAATTLETLLQVQKQEPLAPRQLNPAIPFDLDTIILKCLDKSPSRRYRSARELADELDRFLSGCPILARRVSRAERFWRWCKREPAASSLCAAVLVAMLVGTVVSSYFAFKERQRAEAEAKEHRRADTEAERANLKAREASDNAQTALENAANERRQRILADAATKRARRHLYAAHMNLAQISWEDGQLDALFNLLKQQQPLPGEDDLRGFEWYYWDRLSHSNVAEVGGNDSSFKTVAFSPDGKRLASSGPLGRTAKVWDVVTGQELFTLKGHTNPVNSVVFSPDGKWLASGSSDNTVKVWDAATGQELFTLKGHTKSVNSVTFSPNGKSLASASYDHSIKVWDTATGQESFTLNGDGYEVKTVAFSPDGKQLASGSTRSMANLWDVATRRVLVEMKGHKNHVESVAFSPDGKWLASASSDHTTKLWDVATGQEVFTLKGHSDRVITVAFSPDRKRLATGSWDYTTKIWDVATGQELSSLNGHTSWVNSVAFSPDGKWLATGSSQGTAKIWVVARDGEPLSIKGREGRGIHSVAFSPDGKWLASGMSSGTVKMWDVATGRELFTLNGYTNTVESIAFSPDGKRLVGAGRSDRGSNDWSLDAIKMWNVTTGQELFTLKGHKGSIRSVAFSPDGQRLVSGSEDHTAKVWDAATGQELLTMNGDSGSAVSSVAVSPDGKWLASGGGSDRTAKIWDAATGQELFTLKGHTSAVESVAFSPDGKWLATGSLDRTAKVWDAATGQELLTLKGHTGYVTIVAFTPDGKRLASLSADRTIKLWDLTTGEELLRLSAVSHLLGGMGFSPDGNRLAALSIDRSTVKVWDATPRSQEPSAKPTSSNSADAQSPPAPAKP